MVHVFNSKIKDTEPHSVIVYLNRDKNGNITDKNNKYIISKDLDNKETQRKCSHCFDVDGIKQKVLPPKKYIKNGNISSTRIYVF